jgi:hypothetical protein
MPVENVNSWRNGVHRFHQLQGPNDTEYRTSPSDSDVVPTDRQQLLSFYMHAESTAVSTANGRIRVSINIGPEARIGPQLPVNMTERRVILTLTETGRVERYRLEYDGRLTNDSSTAVRGVRVTRFTRLGETSPKQPDWVATARNRSTVKPEVG